MMKRLLSILLVLSTSVAGMAAAQPAPPEVAAKSYVLLDMTSNQTLAQRDADTSVDPASLTKLMTAYVVFAAIRDKKLTLEQALPVSKRAWSERKGGGSLMFIDTTMTPKVDELLRGMIVQSGNDASVVLAEAVGGTVEEFVAMMNRQAQAMGLKNTAFKNVTGLTEPGHKSTARDLATIAARIIRDFPEYFPYYSIKEYKYNNITQPNRNLLLRRDPTGRRHEDRLHRGRRLLPAGHRAARIPEPRAGRQRRRQAPAAGGRAEHDVDGGPGQRGPEAAELGLPGLRHDAPVRRRQADRLAADLEGTGERGEARCRRRGLRQRAEGRGRQAAEQGRAHRSPGRAAQKGQRVGTIKVTTVGGAPVVDVPLVALEPVAEAGIFGRAWDALRLWIK
jgi:D-alanyl-D-alanine carboxypeptidase (penicillin-binding protein 5/6)